MAIVEHIIQSRNVENYSLVFCLISGMTKSLLLLVNGKIKTTKYFVLMISDLGNAQNINM